MVLELPGFGKLPPIVLSCEHASNAVPRAFRERISPTLLKSHRGYDAGALSVARSLAKTLHAPLFCGEYSRLLIDLNRSVANPDLFGSWAQDAEAHELEAIQRRYYNPFRLNVYEALQRVLREHNEVLHLSLHSFVRVFKGERRVADLGFLYDPKRGCALFESWLGLLVEGQPILCSQDRDQDLPHLVFKIKIVR